MLYYKDPRNITLNYTWYATVVKMRAAWIFRDPDGLSTRFSKFFLNFLSQTKSFTRDERTRTLTHRHARNFSDRLSRGNSVLRRATRTEIYSEHVSNGRRSTDGLSCRCRQGSSPFPFQEDTRARNSMLRYSCMTRENRAAL